MFVARILYETSVERLEDRRLLAVAPELAADINPSPPLWVILHNFRVGDEYPRVAVGDTLFFSNIDEAGAELWVSDGTGDGTRRVSDIRPGVMDSAGGELTLMEGLVYFSAKDAVAGEELWRSDGTPEGTRRVADILPGRASSEPSDLIAAGGLLYFTANDGASGRELWVSDAQRTARFELQISARGRADPIPINLLRSAINCSFVLTMDRTAPSCGRRAARRRVRS